MESAAPAAGKSKRGAGGDKNAAAQRTTDQDVVEVKRDDETATAEEEEMKEGVSTKRGRAASQGSKAYKDAGPTVGSTPVCCLGCACG